MSKVNSDVPSWDYDPVKDIAPVEQFGYVDLVAANATSSIPASITSEDSNFNGIEDPASIAGRPRDVFEQGQASRAIAGYKAPVASEEKHEE